MIVTIDARMYDLSIRKVAADVRKAAALTLTDSAKFANRDFIDELIAKVDRPAPFTVRPSGHGITMAKFGSTGDELFSESFVKPAQARYIQFILEGGGVRGLGDAGASVKHVWVPGQRSTTALGGGYTANPRLSKFGGVANAESSRLYALWDKQRAAWKSPRGAGGKQTYSKGGVFYAELHGKTGFWARPKRTAQIAGAKLERADKFSFNRSRPVRGAGPNQKIRSYDLGQRGSDGRFVATGRGKFETGGRKSSSVDVRVANRGRPILLLESKRQTHHHEIVGRQRIHTSARSRCSTNATSTSATSDCRRDSKTTGREHVRNDHWQHHVRTDSPLRVGGYW